MEMAGVVGAAKVLDGMSQIGIPPNTITYSIITGVLCMGEMIDEVIERMPNMGYPPKSITSSHTSRGWGEEGRWTTTNGRKPPKSWRRLLIFLWKKATPPVGGDGGSCSSTGCSNTQITSHGLVQGDERTMKHPSFCRHVAHTTILRREKGRPCSFTNS